MHKRSAFIKHFDIEIKMIDGQPMFVYETEEGYYEKIPFSMSDLGNCI
ncbi:hypothetical protein M1N67_03895 [Peptococcaceae bacterium]|nr:hypothetical protein [Peptococcaceae bacterium]